MLEYVLSARLSCKEKKKELNTFWRKSKIVLFLYTKSNPNNRSLRLVITMKLSLSKISSDSHWSSAVALGVFKCPFATIIWKSGRGVSHSENMEESRFFQKCFRQITICFTYFANRLSFDGKAFLSNFFVEKTSLVANKKWDFPHEDLKTFKRRIRPI